MSGAAELIEAVCGRGWDAPVQTHLERAEALLAARPGLAIADIWVAATLGEHEALGALLDADPEAVARPGGPRGWVPLLYAAYSMAHGMSGREEAVTAGLEVLLKRGASPDAAYAAPGADHGFSALYGTIAVSEDRSRTLALLAAGASPSDGNSSYHAVESFDMDLLEALGEAGLEHDDISYTIKHAIDMRWGDAIRYLLDLGADPNARHPGAGESTLHWAVKRGVGTMVVGWLLDAGADPNASTRTGCSAYLGLLGQTPYDFALRLGQTEVATQLKAAGARDHERGDEEAFVFAVARGDEAMARGLLQENPRLFQQIPDEDRQLLAHWTQHGQTQAVALACRLGFPLDSTAWMGLTALHWAALRGDGELTRILLAAGAPRVDLGGHFGTPEHTAESCHWYGGDYDEVLVLLREGLQSS